jgi:MtrB/PioB family decaheme-associated outer membrane protein
MKMQKNTAFRISSLTAALMVVYGTPAFAEDLSQWISPESSVSVGAGFQNNDRRELGIFDGRNDNDVKLMLDADINKRDDATGTWNQLRIKNLGLDSRELDFSHSVQGNYGASFEYSRIPRENPVIFNTGLGYTNGGETQRVNAIAPGTSPQNLKLGMHRDRYTFGLNKIIEGVLDGSLDLSVKYRQEEKNGRRNFGAYMTPGNQAIFQVEPINSTTRQLDIVLSYLGKDLQVQGGYYGSWYDNQNNLITNTTATTTIYTTLPPDNQAYQLYLNGSYTISPTTRATMRVAQTTSTQDDYSLLRALPASQLWSGYHGIKAKVVTNEAQLGISSRPMKDLTLLANVFYQDRNDKTKHEPYNLAPDDTTPHDFTTTNVKLEATYRVQPGFKLLGGAYYDIRERSIPFREDNFKPANPNIAGANWVVPNVLTNEREVPYRHKTDELTLKAEATKTILDELNASLTYAHSKRDGSKFYWEDQQNLVNPLHMADRDRNKYGVKVDWSPMESLSLQAQYSEARDDYGDNGLNANYTAPTGQTLGGTGITDGSAKLFSLDADFKLNDNWQLTAWYSYDQSKAKQYAYQATFGFTPNRKSNLEDTGESVGIGIKGKAMADLTLGANLEWNRSVGKYQQSNIKDAANLEENLPDITNKTLRLALNAAYQLDKKSSVLLDFVYDKWDTNDWTWKMWNFQKTALVPMAYASDGTTGNVDNKQSASFVAIRYKYDF